MYLQNQKLLLEQIDKKLMMLKPVEQVHVPEGGWVHSVRSALKMSMRQLGMRLKISAQSVNAMEEREAEGSVTLKALGDAADALGMKLVYGFVPKKQSMEELIEQKALELAREIVMRASTTMKLEGQENSPARIEKAIKSKAEELKNKMPGYLWD